MTAEGREPPHCVRCGEPLLQAITPDGVVTLGGRRVRFRRNTDFVVCDRCLSLYRVRDLQEGRMVPVGDDELLERGEATEEPPG